MTSSVPDLGKRNCIFCQLWRDRKIILRAGTELKFENYESVQHRLQFSGIIKGAQISFHRHFKHAIEARYTKRDSITFLRTCLHGKPLDLIKGISWHRLRRLLGIQFMAIRVSFRTP